MDDIRESPQPLDLQNTDTAVGLLQDFHGIPYYRRCCSSSIREVVKVNSY